MAALVYPTGDLKYITLTGDSNEAVDDSNDIYYDFSRFENIHAHLLVKSWTGAPTNVIVKVQSSNFSASTDVDDWVDVITFTTVTSVPTKEIKVSASGIMPFMRINHTFSGGTAPTFTGFVILRGIGAGYPV